MKEIPHHCVRGMVQAHERGRGGISTTEFRISKSYVTLT